MSAIEWRCDGRQLIIRVHILAPVPSTEIEGITVRALVDTGSTISGVVPTIARTLDLPRRGKRPIGSAGGEIQSERLLFRIGLSQPASPGEPARFPYVFEDIIGFELRHTFKFEALIGMDILSQCDLSLDRHGKCRLAFGRA